MVRDPLSPGPSNPWQDAGYPAMTPPNVTFGAVNASGLDGLWNQRGSFGTNKNRYPRLCRRFRRRHHAAGLNQAGDLTNSRFPILNSDPIGLRDWDWLLPSDEN